MTKEKKSFYPDLGITPTARKRQQVNKLTNFRQDFWGNVSWSAAYSKYGFLHFHGQPKVSQLQSDACVLVTMNLTNTNFKGLLFAVFYISLPQPGIFHRKLQECGKSEKNSTSSEN